MLPKDIAKKVRYIEIHSNKIVNELLAGEYHSAFKGSGIEFNEVREYVPGDEIRSIDWNVTARMGKPFVKRYVEEREQSLFFLVDMSASGAFGSAQKTKNETAAELCALLAFSAIKNNDKVGLMIFTNKVELFIPPEKGPGHVLYIIRELLCFEPENTGTSISNALDALSRMVTKKCIAFMISDFQDIGFEKAIKSAAQHYDFIAVSITDPREQTLPNAGLVELVDSESGEQMIVDTASAAVRRQFAEYCREKRESLNALFNTAAIDHIEIYPDREYLQDLIHFFKDREQRLTYAITR